MDANAKNSNISFKCGYITILGRANVGKSTLLNYLLGQKISITSRKPQTTRCRVLGIKTDIKSQAIYVDTPGIQNEYDSPVHKLMAKEAVNSIEQVDIVLFMIEAMKWSNTDEDILRLIKKSGLPAVVVINKTDKVKMRSELLPFIKKLSTILDKIDIVPVSAKTGNNIKSLEQIVLSFLPIGPPQYSDKDITDRSKMFFAGEFLREKLISRLGDELPYTIAVTIEEFTEEAEIFFIKAIVWVEEKNQRNIVVGKNGKILKLAGAAARKDLECLFDKKVFLSTWVKVKKNWSQSDQILKQIGFTDIRV